MIGVIRVVLTRGEIADSNHLRKVAKDCFTQSVSDPLAGGDGTRTYVSDLENVVYACFPRNASRASFLWQDSTEFEVVIETSYQGHLLRSAEGVVRRLSQRLKQSEYKFRIHVDVNSVQDGQTYFVGDVAGTTEYLVRETGDDAALIAVGVLLIILAKLFLPGYFEEAVAGVIGAALLSVYRFGHSLRSKKEHGVYWRTNV